MGAPGEGGQGDDQATARPGVLVVGSAMVDLTSYVDRLPHAGETMVARRFVQGFGGKGANQAAAAALHGARTTLVACVGDDLFGGPTIEELRGWGVDVEHVRVVPGVHSGVATILVEPSGQNRIALGRGANDALDVAQVGAALDALAANGSPPPAVVLCQLETPQAATAAAFAGGRALGATTILNPGPAAPLRPAVLAACDWLVPNESELAVLLGEAPDHPIDASLDRAPALVEAWGVAMLVTVGAAGAVLLEPGRAPVVVSAPVVEAVDTTGAGDAVAGCFAAGLAAGQGSVAAAERAVAFASASVTRPGTRSSYRRTSPASSPIAGGP